METKKTYANFNELVFEDRNKFYGAYMLRKQYEDNLIVGLFFGVMLAGTIIAIPYISSLFKDRSLDEPILSYTPIEMVDLKDDLPVEKVILEKPQKTDPEPPEPKKSIAFMAPVVTNKDVDQIVTDDDLKDLNPSNKDTDGPIGGFDPINDDKDDEIGNMVGIKKKTYDPYSLEQKPMYPGGDEAMYAFLGKNIIYPERAKNIGTSGKVFVGFVIDEFGNITQVELIRGIGAGCDEEAMRVIKKMPRWKPGKQGGHPVRVKYQIPIEFVLN